MSSKVSVQTKSVQMTYLFYGELLELISVFQENTNIFTEMYTLQWFEEKDDEYLTRQLFYFLLHK